MFEIIEGHDSLEGSAFIALSFERPRLRVCLSHAFPWLITVTIATILDFRPPRSTSQLRGASISSPLRRRGGTLDSLFLSQFTRL